MCNKPVNDRCSHRRRRHPPTTRRVIVWWSHGKSLLLFLQRINGIVTEAQRSSVHRRYSPVCAHTLANYTISSLLLLLHDNGGRSVGRYDVGAAAAAEWQQLKLHLNQNRRKLNANEVVGSWPDYAYIVSRK